MKIIFIRHEKTIGNIEYRYIGRTDQPLCNDGINDIKSHKYPYADIVICSPMKRCIETAKLIYPDKNAVIYDDLRECDFGDFEGKNYIELSRNINYQKWIDSIGVIPFPNGESQEIFKQRSVKTFDKAVFDNKSCGSIVFVVHGGTIMAVLEKYSVPKRDFYDYQVKNGCGFVTEFDDNKIIIENELA